MVLQQYCIKQPKLRKKAALLARDIAAVCLQLRAAIMVDYMPLRAVDMLGILAAAESHATALKHCACKLLQAPTWLLLSAACLPPSGWYYNQHGPCSPCRAAKRCHLLSYIVASALMYVMSVMCATCTIEHCLYRATASSAAAGQLHLPLMQRHLATQAATDEQQ